MPEMHLRQPGFTYIACENLYKWCSDDTLKFAKKADLAHLKSNVDKLDTGKLKNFSNTN